MDRPRRKVSTKEVFVQETGEGEEEYTDYGEGACASPLSFEGFGQTNTTLHRRMMILERKLDNLISENKVRKEEEERGKERQGNLRERVRRLEDNERLLLDENEKLKQEVEHYKRLCKEGLGKVEKENESLKDLMSKEEKKFRKRSRKK